MKKTLVFLLGLIVLVISFSLYIIYSKWSISLRTVTPISSTENEPTEVKSNQINPTNNEHIEQRYYPIVPQKVDKPEIAVQAYFDALYFASNLNPTQKSIVGGTIAMDKEPYQTAYSYWSKSWQAKHSFNEFLSSWEGTAQIQLIKMIPADVISGDHIFFVETKQIKVIEGIGSGIFYYSGFFTVREESEGWRLISKNLKPENMTWEIGGHRPGQANPEEIALTEITKSASPPLGIPQVISNPDGTVTIKYLDSNNKELYSVVMVKLQNGTFQVIFKSVS